MRIEARNYFDWYVLYEMIVKKIFLLSIVCLIVGCGQSEEELYANAIDKMVHVHTEKSIGSGFIVEENSKHFLYTCEHCVLGCKDVHAKLINGNTVKLGKFQVAENRDLARYKISSKIPGFTILPKEDFSLGMRVYAIGDTLGDGVMTFNKGNVLAIGASRIEIDAGVQHGNSGGPIIDENGFVFGVVSSGSLQRDEMTKGTRYDQTRRFAERLDGVKWIDIDVGEYYNGWLTIKEIEQLSDFMMKWSRGYWEKDNLFSDGIEQKYGEKSVFDSENIFTMTKGDMRDDACNQLRSMCEYVSQSVSVAEDLFACERNLQRLIECSNVDYSIEERNNLISRNSKRLRENNMYLSIMYLSMMREGWYNRCILECETYLNELRALECHYLGCRQKLTKKLNGQISFYKNEKERIRSRRSGVYDKYIEFCVPHRFGDKDDLLPMSPLQEALQKEWGHFFKRTKGN